MTGPLKASLAIRLRLAAPVLATAAAGSGSAHLGIPRVPVRGAAECITTRPAATARIYGFRLRWCASVLTARRPRARHGRALQALVRRVAIPTAAVVRGPQAAVTAVAAAVAAPATAAAVADNKFLLEHCVVSSHRPGPVQRGPGRFFGWSLPFSLVVV